MKLLFVHQRLGAFGGAEANILLTATELRQKGHEVGLLYRAGTGRNEADWLETFSRCELLPNPCSPGAIRKAVTDFAPEVIYLHSISDLAIIEALLDTRVPVIRMVHDHEMYCMRGYKYNYFTRKPCERPVSARCVFPCLGVLTRNREGRFPLRIQSYFQKLRELRINRRCERFIVYSNFSKQELVRNGFPGDRIDIHVPIPCWGENGPISRFSERNLVLFAGQIIRGKGVDVLLRALAQVDVPFECAILGDGNQRKHCERLSRRLGLEGKVQFKGFLSTANMTAYYLEASVFVVSSVWPEPFGMSGPEAMRFGLPVVAFDAGGIKEWLTDGQEGFLVPWMDSQQMANRIRQLLLDKSLARELGHRGLVRVNREYTPARHVAHLEKIFASVAQATLYASREASRLDTCVTGVEVPC